MSVLSVLFGPSKSSGDLALRVAGVVGFAALTAALAQVSFRVPGSSVPVTMQTLAVSLAALALGARLGSVSMVLYVLLGVCGLPVFAEQAGGWKVATGASGGYLIGFVLAQPVMALSARDGKAFAGSRGLIMAMVLGNALVLGCGAAWLVYRIGMSWSGALDEGVWPFLPGAMVKSAVAFVFGFGLVPFALKRGW